MGQKGYPNRYDQSSSHAIIRGKGRYMGQKGYPNRYDQSSGHAIICGKGR